MEENWVLVDYDQSIKENEHGLNNYSESDEEKQKQSIKSIEEKSEDSDKDYSDPDYDDPEILDRDMRRYSAQLKASDGFDVDNFLKLNMYGMQIPIRDPNNYDILRECTEFAIEDYNEKNHTKYHLVEVLKANVAVSAIASFYVTFVAVDDDDDDSKVVFQAVVFDGIPYEDGTPDREVKCFRVKPDSQSKVAAAS